ncbi:MAG TPA: DnaJ domain-containing protein [Candidatus Polarisedimenticolaceae bacterium]|nr:DnaJ domain-containing protein [Candidatus Polarisedimenticolaceae bacterium]
MSKEAQRDRQLARLLCERAAQQSSGIVTATRGRLRRLLCMEKGWLVFATSNLIEEQFIEYLVRTGSLSPGARADAVETAAHAKTTPTAVLLAAGRPPMEAMRRAMEGLVRELLTSTLEWPDGAFAFEPGLPRLDGEVTVRLAPRGLVLAHAKRHPAALDAVRVRIGPPDLRPVAAIPAEQAATQLDALGAYLIAVSDGKADLSEIVKKSPADEEPTLRTIYGFLLVGLLEPEDPAVRRARELRGQGELTREECIGRLTLATGQDHYGVLGVDKTARPETVRDAYYALARRYHPDRFRSGPLMDLLPRFEHFFASVTDAYNTLGDPDMRREYDDALAAPLATEAKTSDAGYLARQNFLRGRALASLRKFNEAVTFLENAIQLDPGQAEYHLELGLLLARNPRRREDAERHLLQAVELAPTLVAAYVALGQMYLRAGRAGRAARMAREALRWEPSYVDASALLTEAGNAADDREDLRRGVFRSS